MKNEDFTQHKKTNEHPGPCDFCFSYDWVLLHQATMQLSQVSNSSSCDRVMETHHPDEHTKFRPLSGIML